MSQSLEAAIAVPVCMCLLLSPFVLEPYILREIKREAKQGARIAYQQCAAKHLYARKQCLPKEGEAGQYSTPYIEASPRKLTEGLRLAEEALRLTRRPKPDPSYTLPEMPFSEPPLLPGPGPSYPALPGKAEPLLLPQSEWPALPPATP